MSFHETTVEALTVNPFTLINKGWMLITAGTEQKHNTMTASWGSVGELWGKYVSTIYIRPSGTPWNSWRNRIFTPFAFSTRNTGTP